MSDVRVIPVGLDPSVSGLAGYVGERVVSADGAHIWDKTGTGVTAWQAPGTGSGGVASVVAGAGISVDSSTPTAPVVTATGSFGSDTLVQLPNSAAAQKTVSEWISAYESNTAGAEQSSVTIKVLQGGTQNAVFKLTGTVSVDLPQIWRFFNDTDTGFQISAANTIAVLAGGSQYVFFSTSGLQLNAGLGAQLGWSGTAAGVAYASGTGTITVRPSAAAGNVDLGTAGGALATNATAGFVTIPTCAGAATGAATITAGQAAMIYDSTNNKIYVRSGGTWRSTAALT